MRSLSYIAASCLLLSGAVACTDVGSGAKQQFAQLPALGEYPSASRSTPRERVWRPAPLKQDLVLGTQGHSLVQPLNVRVSPDGNLFVMDFGATRVAEFGPDGRLVRQYGTGKGRGPGELLSLTDIAVPNDREVWALDPSGGRIVVFDRGGRPVRHVPLALPTTRMQVRGDHSFLLMSLNGYLFAEFDSAGERKRGFGHLLPDQGTRGIALQGEFVETPRDGIVWAPMRAGYLARFTQDGRVAFYVETVDRQKFPDVKQLPNGALTVDGPKRMASRSIGVSGNDILVLVPLQKGENLQWAVDVYALRDGAYRYSFRMPTVESPRLASTDDAVFIISDSTVVRWRR